MCKWTLWEGRIHSKIETSINGQSLRCLPLEYNKNPRAYNQMERLVSYIIWKVNTAKEISLIRTKYSQAMQNYWCSKKRLEFKALKKEILKSHQPISLKTKILSKIVIAIIFHINSIILRLIKWCFDFLFKNQNIKIYCK